MRSLRTLLRGESVPSPAPGALPDRLRSIAGTAADDPLWARPFDRPGAAAGRITDLPSRRRSHLHRRVLVSTCLVTLLAGVVMVGWMAAPVNRQVVVEPTADARVGFATALAQIPLSNVAVGAVAADPTVSEPTEQFDASGGPSTDAVELGSSGGDCLTMLQRAQAAAADVAVSGVQSVAHRDGSGWRNGTVEVETLPGFGTALSFGGNTGFSPSTAQPLLELASFGGYELNCGHAVGEVAGRRAAVVEATSGSGTTTRWWLDEQTDYLLWTDRFVDQVLESRAGFVSVTFGGEISVSDSSEETGGGGSSGGPSLAGLSLLNVSGDGDGAIQGVYGDGMTTLLVSQQPGTLVPGESMTWDAERGVYHAVDGAVTILAWQSDDVVWTLVTDGSIALADEASGALPAQTAEQCRSGRPSPFGPGLVGCTDGNPMSDRPAAGGSGDAGREGTPQAGSEPTAAFSGGR